MFFLPPFFLLPKLLRGIFQCIIIFCRNIAKLFWRIAKIPGKVKNLTTPQKYFFGFAVISVVMLFCALPDGRDEEYGYYVFLRIVTCASLAWLLVEKFPMWLNFSLLLLAILHNPIIPIHLADREVWAFFNIITIPALIIPWVVLIYRKGKS